TAQRERRRDCPRTSRRRHRRAADSHQLERTASSKCKTRPHLRLRGRRPGRGHLVGGFMTPNIAEPEISNINLERRHPASRTPTPTIAGAPNIRREINAEQVCVLTFDRPGSSANVFDRATLNELNEHLDFISTHPELQGLVLVSAKKSIFIAGADLHSI